MHNFANQRHWPNTKRHDRRLWPAQWEEYGCISHAHCRPRDAYCSRDSQAMTPTHNIIIGIDAGTSVIKAVAFDLSGRQIGTASVRNSYATGSDGSATQSLSQTWTDCASALRALG